MEYVNHNGRIILSGCLIINENKEVLLLYRKGHNHYETPGGKVHLEECKEKGVVTVDDLAKTAEREVFEELGDKIKIEKLKYFGEIEFIIPDGRLAIAHKFITKIVSGEPKINEANLFLKMDWLPLKHLGKYPISPDLKRLLP
ncbi:MAG: NUDIX hydrolase, partial [Nanoarchaeota archaeon]|nr:NUDIX hydrolase [Nanoarchaeota archaeon]MCG2719905.1 NUDIX hydrolase [Nanoarchaeota archaeon]